MEQRVSAGIQRYVDKANELTARRLAYRTQVRALKFDTIAVHGMYRVEEAFAGGQGGIIEPIFPSTSQAYRDSDEMEAGLAYLIPTWCYSRIHNPTVFYLEETLALLEAYGCAGDASGAVHVLGHGGDQAGGRAAARAWPAGRGEDDQLRLRGPGLRRHLPALQRAHARARRAGALGDRAVGDRGVGDAGRRQHPLPVRARCRPTRSRRASTSRRSPTWRTPTASR